MALRNYTKNKRLSNCMLCFKNSLGYEEDNFVIRNQYSLLVLIGIIAAITNLYLVTKAIKNVQLGRYSHIVNATLFLTMFLFCGVELAVTNFICNILGYETDRKEDPTTHQIVQTITETRRRVIGAVTAISTIYNAIDRLIHFNNVRDIQRRKAKVKWNAIFFVITATLAIFNCVLMSFMESWWRANKRYVDDPKDEDIIYYSSFKIFDDGKHTFNVYRILDLFDAMIPVTYVLTIFISFTIYCVILVKITQKYCRLRNCTFENESKLRLILKKSIHTVVVNLISVILYSICWFPYAILSRLSEMNTNCNRSYYTVLLFQFEQGSFGWEFITILYSIDGLLFYLFAVINSVVFILAHRQYRLKKCLCCNCEGSYDMVDRSKVESYVPIEMTIVDH